MTDTPPIRPTRLRQFAGRFELVMNRNQFELKRTTINRATATKTTNELKRKISMQLDSNNNDKDENTRNAPVPVVPPKPTDHPIFAVKARHISDGVRKWITPKPLLQKTIRKNEVLYDASKPATHPNLTEEAMFEIFNNLTLNELVNTANASNGMKLAAQKFFEVQYTKVNLAWLIDGDDDKFTLLQAQRLLQCFGNFISTLIVNSNQLKEAEQKEKLLEIIARHCAGVVFWDTI